MEQAEEKKGTKADSCAPRSDSVAADRWDVASAGPPFLCALPALH